MNRPREEGAAEEEQKRQREAAKASRGRGEGGQGASGKLGRQGSAVIGSKGLL